MDYNFPFADNYHGVNHDLEAGNHLYCCHGYYNSFLRCNFEFDFAAGGVADSHLTPALDFDLLVVAAAAVVGVVAVVGL